MTEPFMCPPWHDVRQTAEIQMRGTGLTLTDFSFLYLYPTFPLEPETLCGECYRCRAESRDANNIRLKYFELAKGIAAKQRDKISKAEYHVLRMNSYERDLMLPYYSNAALAYVAEYTLANCRPISGRVAASYDEFAIHRLLPLLLERALKHGD